MCQKLFSSAYLLYILNPKVLKDVRCLEAVSKQSWQGLSGRAGGDSRTDIASMEGSA
jgi:hypothetical protein